MSRDLIKELQNMEEQNDKTQIIQLKTKIAELEAEKEEIIEKYAQKLTMIIKEQEDIRTFCADELGKIAMHMSGPCLDALEDNRDTPSLYAIIGVMKGEKVDEDYDDE